MSQGSVINAAKRPNDNPDAVNASRFVRFDTGNSTEPLFASRAQAYAWGRAAKPSLAAVVSTTGVSSTTVASRVSTAVTAAAIATTRASSRGALP